MLDLNSRALRRRLAKKDYVFDEDNFNYTSNAEHDRFFIRRTQASANDLLAVRGYVFLNDVLSALGLKPTAIGQIAGWTQGPIEIKETASRYRGMILVDLSLEINHEGVILFELGD